MIARKYLLLWRRLTLSQKLLLIYFILLAVLGLPLALGALKLNLDQRRKAETVTIKATIPPNPFNTPNYKELYNKPIMIETNTEVAIIPEQPIAIPITITDPDWIPGLHLPQARFSSSVALPHGLKILCSTRKKIKSCKLTGTPKQALVTPQTIIITATDALGSQTKSKMTLQ